MIAGTKSGSGKTTITCGILKCLVEKGYAVSSFKCGPDYIDPMFHSKVIGTKSGNLDGFFTDSNVLNYLLYKNSQDTDISVIEGVMGYYDGIGFTGESSSYSIAVSTRTPVILVINCKGMSSSIGALLKGFVQYTEVSNIKGVIFNQLPAMMYENVKKLAKELGIISFGYVPTMSECVIESRHLGLVTADEIEDIKQRIEILAQKLTETIDLEGIIALSKQAEDMNYDNTISITKINKMVTIAVADDNAFCFHYKDNFDMLKEIGCTLIPFSPLKDKKLPDNVSGLILSGGYPELYADSLSENVSMLNSIQTAIEKGMPTIAECGGFMYLHDYMEDTEGKEYAMAGVIKGKCFKSNRLQRFGYINIEAKKDSLIARNHDLIKAHEFHYWDSELCGNDFHAIKASGTKEWDCIHATETLYAGFPHLYFYSNPSMAERFVNQCIQFGKNKLTVNSELENVYERINVIDSTAMAESKKHWDNIAKPIEGLGLLEDMIIKLAGIQGNEMVDIRKRAIVIMCSDNGVVAEHVTQTDSSVTAIVTENFAKGISSVNRMAMVSNAKVIPVDIGIGIDINLDGVLDRKITYGTANIAKEPAMSRDQALQAISIGIQVVKDLKEEGYGIICTGEMGIGNTTTSSAIASVLLDMPVEEVTGKGAGLSQEGVLRKICVIKRAIEVNKPEQNDPIDVLAKLGGYDIAGITGLFLGGAVYRIPIVIDGMISAVAALIATRLCAKAVDYMIPSHMSKEPASIMIMKELGLNPIIHGNLALGEGTGAVLLISMLDMALNVYNQNNTFADMNITSYEKFV